MSRSTLLIAFLAWAAFCGAGIYVAAGESATSDEVPHIAAGVRYLQGDFSLNPEHPPLVKVLAALGLPPREPALAFPTGEDPVTAQWSYGSAFLHSAKQSPLTLLLRARLPVLLLNSLLLWVVAAWANGIAGAVAARAALLLTAACPLWLAHASLVTTDAAATLFYFAAAYAAARLCQADPTRRARDAAWLALSLCLALMTKYSMLAAMAFIPAGLVLDALRHRRPDVVLWGAGACVLGALAGISLAWGLPPRLSLYVEGVRQVGSNHLANYAFYAFGSVFHGQDPLYFLRALSVKVSVPVLALCVLCPILWRSRTQASDALRMGFSWSLVVPPIAYLLLMTAKAPAIGVRYVLPVLPFLLVLAGVGLSGLWQQARLRRLVAPLMAAQLFGFVVALRATPLAFFNGLGCHTSDPVPCLDDSNVDWGQALPALAKYRDEHFDHTPIRVFYFGSSPPAAYVPAAEIAQTDELVQPRRALYAMSLHLRARCPPQAWPRRLPPSEVVGGAYAIFDLRH